jgi:hypothetical protein
MDESKEFKAPSANPGADSAATPPAGEPAESKIELASIDSPTIAPTMADLTAGLAPDMGGIDAPQIERARAAEQFEDLKPGSQSDAAPASQDITPLPPPAAGRASRKFSKFSLLAAAVVLAAAFGATAGVLAASGLARLAGEAATAEAPAALQTAIAQLRSEIAALKAGVDTANRSTNAQVTKLVERLDRAERAQAGTNKTDAAFPRDTTGSVTLPSAAAAPVPPAAVPSSGIVAGWAVRDVYRGVAMLQSRAGGMVEVEPGDVLPGLGRIEAIRRQDGRWVVITSKGMITSMR